MKVTRVYTEAEAKILGRRLLCYEKGHDLYSALEIGRWGGEQMQYDRAPGQTTGAASDEIKCHCCDVVFSATYKVIGTVVSN